MKANELMIGDFFLYKGNVVEIVSIDGGTKTVWIDSEKVSALRKVEELKPITLTTEILEKNGFENVYRGRYRFDDDKGSIVEVSTINNKIKWVRVSKYDEDIEEQLSNCTFNDMYFVHQLQHALCGIEKEIVL